MTLVLYNPELDELALFEDCAFLIRPNKVDRFWNIGSCISNGWEVIGEL